MVLGIYGFCICHVPVVSLQLLDSCIRVVWRMENHTHHACPPQVTSGRRSFGRRIDRSSASAVVVDNAPCLWSKSKSKSRSLSPSSSIVVVVGCRRRWLSTTSQFIVVVRHRCRSWSWSWQTSLALVGRRRPLSSRSSWIQEAKWREWHGGVFLSFSEQNDTHTYEVAHGAVHEWNVDGEVMAQREE